MFGQMPGDNMSAEMKILLSIDDLSQRLLRSKPEQRISLREAIAQLKNVATNLINEFPIPTDTEIEAAKKAMPSVMIPVGAMRFPGGGEGGGFGGGDGGCGVS